MAKFKIEKTNNYTIISNNIFKNKLLSLKAKGLLCLMLSLPENWDYTVNGLTKLNKDGRDSIASTLKELEKNGYLKRNRIRNEHGCIIDIEYIIYEFPFSKNEQTTNAQPTTENPELVSFQPSQPITENPELVPFQPITENPKLEIPVSDLPMTDLPQQSNTKCINTKVNNVSNPSIITIDAMIDSIKNQIDYNTIISCDSSLKTKCDEIIDIIVETLLSNRKTYHLNNTDISEAFIKKRFQKLTSADIYYVINCLDSTTSNICNMRQYLFTALYNAPSTRAFYYAQKAQQNLAEGRGVTC